MNLYTPSQLKWTNREVTVAQTTTIPEGDTAELQIQGFSDFTVALRIPSWAADAQVFVNNEAVDVSVAPGTYAKVERAWADGDVVKVQLPMSLHTVVANDDDSLAALAFGPTILSGNSGDRNLNGHPELDLGFVERQGDDSLEFMASVGGETVTLRPFFDAHGFNYKVYWKFSGQFSE